MSLPLVSWGTPQAINAGSWVDGGGTITTTAGQTDPFGGSSAHLLTDTDAAAISSRRLPLTIASGTTWVSVAVKKGTSDDFQVQFYEITGGTDRATWNGLWTAGVPALSLLSGSGSAYGPVSLGSSWYLFLVSATGVVAGNQPNLYLKPSSGALADTKTTYFYVANMVLLDYPDMAVSEAAPREGSAWAQGASGTEDAWIVATDQRLRVQVRWVPQAPRSTPVIVSGWYGENEHVGFNAGVKAMLTAGRDKTPLVWVPDRAACTTYQSAYLVEPMQPGTVQLEPSGDRTFEMILRGSSVFTGY